MKTYNLFLSHSWTYSNHYENLINLLNNRPYFSFNDHSVPKNDPVHDADNDAQLRQAIKNHMQGCHVILIVAGVYATHSKWINIEIDIAKNGFANPKPIIAIRPRGNVNVSKPVADAADELVGWNTESVVAAIRKHG